MEGFMSVINDPRPHPDCTITSSNKSDPPNLSVELAREFSSQTTVEYQFARLAEIWVVRFGTEIGGFPTDRGLEYIGQLLSRPHKPIPVLELTGSNKNRMPDGRSYQSVGDVGQDVPAGNSWQDILDDEAKANYKARLQNITDLLETARGANDASTIKELEGEYEKVMTRLATDLGLGKKNRQLDSPLLTSKSRRRQLGPQPPAKKAMEAVRKALARAYDRMSEDLTNLVGHLRQTIHPEGVAYTYRPYPSLPWKFEKISPGYEMSENGHILSGPSL
jgi:hypothetical protein